MTRYLAAFFALVALLSLPSAPAVAEDPIEPEQPGETLADNAPLTPIWLTRGFRRGPVVPPIPDPPPFKPINPDPNPKGATNIGTPITVDQGRGGEGLIATPDSTPGGNALFNGLAGSGGIAGSAEQETRRQVRLLIRRLG